MDEEELLERIKSEFDAEEVSSSSEGGRLMARGGGPGGLDMNALLKQAQQMQAEMAKAQEQLANEEVEASAGGGMVKVRMSGDLQLKGIEIDPEAIDPEDAEMLADMVMAAVNEAIRSAQELATARWEASPEVSAG